jgi:NADP-dependent 3-hydroxy acid dehydrogenase YdfG
MSQTHRPRALVTGASRGIGAAVARALAPSHALLLGGRDRAALEALAAELPSAEPWRVELTDGKAMASAAAAIDGLDVLVHSAGAWEPGLIGETATETWRRLFEVNVFAVAELTRLLLPALRTEGGRIVMVNSSAGRRVSPGRGAYGASKFALRALADALHAEEAASGVLVTSVYPGRVATDMQRRVAADEGTAYDADDYLSPEAVARVVAAAVGAPPDVDLTEVVVYPARPTRPTEPPTSPPPRRAR